eukprot:9728642-Ditylum_brightwellii.AAC.1
MPVQVDGWNCGSRIALRMLQILRYFTAENINMKTSRGDEHFANCIGNNVIFKYQVDYDMDEFRAKIRKFIL